MKRILSLVLILILSLSVLTACDVPAQLQDILASLGIGTPSVSYDLDNAKSTLRELYPNLLPTKETPVPSTIANFNVTKVLTCADGKYTVTWSTNVDSIEIVDYVPTKEGDIFSAETTSTVKIKMGSEDVNYVLTATITAPDNTTAVVDFTLVIPKLDCDSHEDYMAAVKDQELMIKGIVVAINSVSLGNKYNHVFLADTDVVGGYYCYKLAADPADLGVKVGMTVTVSGKMSPYSGMQEITGGQLVILDDSIQSVEPVDITDKFAAGADLGAYVALPVTIKGVEIGTQDLVAETSQYLYFSIGEEKGYVRTYVTDFPAGMLTAADKATIDADHAAHFGYKADVTGILILYSGAPYLIPMSVTPFTNYVEVIKTDAEKVASEKETLKVTNSFTADGTMTLPLVGVNYDDVTIAWTSDSEYIVIAEDGTATVTVPDTKTVVKLTATLTCGEATETVEIEVTLSNQGGEGGEGGGEEESGPLTSLKTGDQVVIVAPAHNMALSATKIATYYNVGVDVSAGFGSITDAEIWVVTVNDDGSYTFTSLTGKVLALAADYSSLNEEGENKSWALEAKDGAEGIFYLKNTVRGNYLEWYASKNNWSTYATSNLSDLFELSFYRPTDATVGGGEEGGEEGGEGGEDTPDVPTTSGKIELTVDSLGIPSQSYTANTATVNGVGFEWIQIGNYGDGIQVRDKNGNTSSLWNTTAFSAPIARIELVYSSTKDVTHSNPDCAIYSFGNGVDNYTCTVKLSTEAGVKTYTITPDAETYTFFRFEHDLGYTQYWDSITIVLVDGTVISQ